MVPKARGNAGAGTHSQCTALELQEGVLRAGVGRVIILFPMLKTFSEITKDLEITQQKLSATAQLEQKRALLRHIRYLLEQADNLVQKLERQILQESKRD